MSIANFIPTLWSGSILRWLEKSHVFAAVCNRNYEGMIRQAGDKVKISQIGDITINSYAKTDITVQELDSAGEFLTVDQQKYFAFQVDDIDNIQANVELMTAATQKAAYAIRDVADQFISALYPDAGVVTGLGTTGTPLTVTSDGASSSTKGSTLLSMISRRMDDGNMPLEGRWIVIPPWLHMKLVQEKVLLQLSGSEGEYVNGRIGRAFGFNIMLSNNVSILSSTKFKVLAGNNEAITFADQIISTEAFRPQLRFGDAVKGLHVYGAKVVQPKCLACATISEGTT